MNSLVKNSYSYNTYCLYNYKSWLLYTSCYLHNVCWLHFLTHHNLAVQCNSWIIGWTAWSCKKLPSWPHFTRWEQPVYWCCPTSMTRLATHLDQTHSTNDLPNNKEVQCICTCKCLSHRCIYVLQGMVTSAVYRSKQHYDCVYLDNLHKCLHQYGNLQDTHIGRIPLPPCILHFRYSCVHQLYIQDHLLHMDGCSLVWVWEWTHMNINIITVVAYPHLGTHRHVFRRSWGHVVATQSEKIVALSVAGLRSIRRKFILVSYLQQTPTKYFCQ